MLHVVLVGGGLSSASVLMRLAADQVLPAHASVVMVDPAGETGGGAAYHRGVHPALLLNDPVVKVDRTGLGFGRWLTEHATTLIEDAVQVGDARVDSWVAAFGDDLARSEVGSLYVPRSWFGRFVRERVVEARRALADNGVSVTTIAATVIDIRPDDGTWLVVLDSSERLVTRSVVLATGGPVASPAIPEGAYFRGGPGLDMTAVERGITRVAGGDVLLLGSAASAVEMVYCVESDPRLRESVDRIVSISPSGRLPDGLPVRSGPEFAATAVRRGAETAVELMEDLERDVVDSRRAGYSVPDVYPTLHAEFLRVFERLPAAEKKNMVDVHSRKYLSLLRKTSTVYAAGARQLAQRGKLVTVAGRVESVHPSSKGFDVTLVSGEVVTGRLVLDCRGFGSLKADPLLDGMIRSGVVRPNDSGLGLWVDAGFEAAPGLAVLGPLLAGTAQGGEYIWHLEDIPRIHAYADRIAAGVGRRIHEQPGPAPTPSQPITSSRRGGW